MIPKTLYMIWIGDSIPVYAEKAVSAYKEYNKDFNVVFLNYTVSQMENIPESDPTDMYDLCFRNTVVKCVKNRKTEIDYYKNMRFIQYVADKFRFDLLHEFGGIYVDCDTWPIKPFDDALLSDGFIASQIDYSKNFRLITDIYFAGCEKHRVWNDMKHLIPNPGNYDLFSDTLNNKVNADRYRIIKERFFNGKLGLDEHYLNGKYYYIDHFYDGGWNGRWNKDNITVPKCKFDEI